MARSDDHPIYAKARDERERTGRDPWIGVADVAKLVRGTLAAEFPGVKFYVRSRSFAGGSAIDVYYDGIALGPKGEPLYVLIDFDGNVLDPTPRTEVDHREGRFGFLPKDGAPRKRDVEAALAGYVGGGFDGSIDLSYHNDSWLNPDGTASFAATSGTEGSKGYVPRQAASRKQAGAILVSMGSKYLSVNDTLPYEQRARAS